MATVNEHQEAEAAGDAAALQVDVSWLFAEPPPEASVEAGSSSGNQRHKRRHGTAKPRTARRHSPARDEEISQPTVEAWPSSSTRPHSRRGQAPAAAARAAHRHNPDSDEDVFRAMIFMIQKRGSRLMQAAKKGAVEEVRAELAAGADVGERDVQSIWETVLHCAAQKGHPEVVRCLLEHGAEVDATNFWMQTPLHAVAKNFGSVGERSRAAVARVLLASSADPNARDLWQRTPLHWAAWNGDPEVAAALLDAGADREVRDYELKTPLDIAKQQKHQQLVEMLK